MHESRPNLIVVIREGKRETLHYGISGGSESLGTAFPFFQTWR